MFKNAKFFQFCNINKNKLFTIFWIISIPTLQGTGCAKN